MKTVTGKSDLLQHHGETGQPTVPGVALLNMAKFYHLSSSAHWSCNKHALSIKNKNLLVFTTNITIIRMYMVSPVSVILTVQFQVYFEPFGFRLNLTEVWTWPILTISVTKPNCSFFLCAALGLRCYSLQFQFFTLVTLFSWGHCQCHYVTLISVTVTVSVSFFLHLEFRSSTVSFWRRLGTDQVRRWNDSNNMI